MCLIQTQFLKWDYVQSIDKKKISFFFSVKVEIKAFQALVYMFEYTVDAEIFIRYCIQIALVKTQVKLEDGQCRSHRDP